MKKPDILRAEEIREVIDLTIEDKTPVTMSHLYRGKWHMTRVLVSGLGSGTINVDIDPAEDNAVNIQINQPVGISIQREFNKYIFQSTIVGFESSVNEAKGGTIVLERPFKIERMQRRSFKRMPVPGNMKVDVLFWHRGYQDSAEQAPVESYWQGDLCDLSAGGMRMEVDASQAQYYKAGQIIGMQFTPMHRQKPIQLEAQVRHVDVSDDGTTVCIGTEFVGLEASLEGREKLRRLVTVVNEYKVQNDRHGYKTESSARAAQVAGDDTVGPMASTETMTETVPAEFTGTEQAAAPVDIQSIAEEM